MNELVVYKNEMNMIPMRNFNAVEMDLFFSICSQMRDKNTRIIKFTFEELKELSDYKPTATARFADDIESVYRKMVNLSYYHRENKKRELFVLFTGFSIDEKEMTAEIRTNPDFKYILNQLTHEFTKFELEEFVSLRGSYAKSMYRLLKQYRSTGYRKLEINLFRELLCIPKSYKMGEIDRTVLKSIQAELSPYFDKLRIQKIKAKKGRKIEFIEFKFKAESDFKGGKKTFKDGSGHYYEKDILELTKEEVEKAFPNAFPK